MTDQSPLTKKLLRTVDVCHIYSVSRTSMWRYKQLENDPFPQPLHTTLTTTSLYDAEEVDGWFKRNFYKN